MALPERRPETVLAGETGTDRPYSPYGQRESKEVSVERGTGKENGGAGAQ